MPSGIFIIDKYYCKNHVILNSNNKTNTLIESKYLYMMLNNCIKQGLHIQFPECTKKYITY